jgi:myosin-1
LGCPTEKLTKAFLNRTIEARGEFVTSPITYDQCLYARDALAKAIYDRLFTWLVKKLNASLDPDYDGKKTLMGILDIYGFEIFEKNRYASKNIVSYTSSYTLHSIPHNVY